MLELVSRSRSHEVRQPRHWGRRVRLRRRFGAIWLSAGVIVSSYFGALVAVRALDTGEPDCWDTCEDAPADELGNVLVFGDSILKGYYPTLQRMLQPNDTTPAECLETDLSRRGVLARLVYGRFGAGVDYCGSSFGVNQCVDRYLATSPNNFSVIHFNWGLHDISPAIYTKVTLDEYEANMEYLYHALKRKLSRNGTMIFATTTPVPHSYDSKKRKNSDVIELNERARKLFGPKGKYPHVKLNDLYGSVVAMCRNDPATACYPESCDCPIAQNDGVHFSPAGQRLNAISVAYHIAPNVPGALDSGDRIGEIEEKAVVHKWEHWKVALFAQVVLLFFIGVALSCVAYWRARKGGDTYGLSLGDGDGFDAPAHHEASSRSTTEGSEEPFTPRAGGRDRNSTSPFHRTPNAGPRSHFPTRPASDSAARMLNDDGEAADATPPVSPELSKVYDFEDPMSPDERRHAQYAVHPTAPKTDASRQPEKSFRRERSSLAIETQGFNANPNARARGPSFDRGQV